jgi:hypothetical protein
LEIIVMMVARTIHEHLLSFFILEMWIGSKYWHQVGVFSGVCLVKLVLLVFCWMRKVSYSGFVYVSDINN